MRSFVTPCLTIIMSAICLSGMTQPDPQVTFNATNPTNSDYQILLTFSYNTSYCDCTAQGPQNTTIQIVEDFAFGGPLVASYSNLFFADSPFAVGPGYSENLAALFTMSGWRTWIGTSDGIFCVNTICGSNECTCLNSFGTPTVAVSTSALKDPVSVTATEGAYDNQVILTWGKGTNFPNNLHDYNIYRDGNLITTVPGTGPYTYTDALPPGSSHDYTIKTHIATYGDQESGGVTVQGSTFSFEASDGDFYNRVRVKWNNVPDNTEDIRIERSVHDAAGVQTGREEIVIMSASATTYNDNGGIPGFSYTYYLSPLAGGAPIIEYTDAGHSRPDGKIAGHVRSQLGAGVLGIDVSVTLLNALPAGGTPLPGGCLVTYCATTDVDGYYEIRDVYYFAEADFEVKPTRPGHVFTPDSIVRTLNENGRTVVGVDFTDETVFTVGGRVTYPGYNGDSCAINNATIRIDTNDFGITTDANGYWSFTLFDERAYTFSADYYGHRFENSLGQTSTTVLIDTDVNDIHFIDVETGNIEVVVQGGCGVPLGDSVEILVTAPGNCWNETYWTGADGTLTIEDLPARDYTVAVTDIDGAAQPSIILNQIGTLGGVEIDLDLTSKDSVIMFMDKDTTIITPEQFDTLPNNQVIVTPADTQVVTVQDSILKPANSLARFIYRSPLDIDLDFADAGAQVLSGCGDLVLMEQGQEYSLVIDVRESLNLNCPIDSGFLKIYDHISDREDTPIYVPIINGIAEYQVVAGEPVIAASGFHDHEKFLYIIPEVDQLDAEPVEFWALVTGVKSNAPSVITRSPGIPMLILHDPPGDNSYAFVEQGQSFKSFTTTSYLSSEEGGGFVKLGGGFKADVFSVKFKLGLFAEVAISGGRNDKNETGFETEITFTEQFSTSSADNFTGDEGDVYIGASLNQEFSIGESLTYDISTCSAETDSVPQLDLTGFATTFFYTEKHLEQTLLPTIALLMKEFLEGTPNTTTTEDTVAFNQLRADSVSWARILAQNELGRDSLAVFEENLTFSAGASVSRAYSTSESSSRTVEYEQFVSEEFTVGGVFEFEGFGGYIEASAGAMGKFRQSTVVASGGDTTQTRTVGYVLDDGDIGDFFSVDVKRDTFFNVPSFNLKLGTSSCPYEEGTQTRDKPEIVILKPQADDVPADGEATFVAQLTNNSESGDTREYHVRVVTTTNPDGALFNLGGRNINNGPATFFLEKNQTLNVALTVKKGPLASNYEQVGIMIYPPCEYALWEDNGVLKNVDTAYVTVNFQSECTNVNLLNPGDGWLVNQNNNDILHITYSGYNVNNPHFEGVTLQFKREGEGYVNQLTIPKDSLNGPFYDVFFNVSNFDDGAYRLRARANCIAGVGYTYSSEHKGIIDRQSLAPFGMPSPSDGFLQQGQEVSVTYDKNIDCDLGDYPTEISLVRTDNSVPIPFTTQCSGNKLIIVTNPPLVDMPSLDGVEVTARVHLLQDENGNVQKYPVEWTFKVNSKPVFWDPDFVYASFTEDETATVTGVLKNDALLSKSFSLDSADAPGIIAYPEWLTPVQTHGTVLSNATYVVDFAVDPELSPGVYQGMVTAAVDSLPVSMNVIVELLARPVNWSFDPAQYENSMNVIAQFSLTDADIPLSEDSRDLIGAFVNGEIRGIANIEYVANKTAYAAFLTVYSDDDGGNNAEEISFHFWRALSGVEYKAVETLQFQPDGAEGTVSAPFILHPEGIFQVIPLNAGWNWISFNMEHDDMSRERIFESIISTQSTNTILVKNQDDMSEYNPNSGWQGNLKVLELGKGYLVHLSDHFDTLRVAGFPPAAPVEIDVDDTWNWIGFPEQGPRPVDDVLSGLSATDGDLLKNQHAFAAYDNTFGGWIGNLKEFEPGRGYKLLASSNGSIEYGLDPNTADPTDFEFNMSVTAILNPAMLDQSKAEDLKVCAYIDGICYGQTELEFIDELDEYRALLLISGAPPMQDAVVEFRVVNEQRRTQYFANGEPVYFALDDIVGTVMDPYVLFKVVPQGHRIDNAAYELFQNNPNPASQTTTITFRIPFAEQVTLEIFDAHGALVYNTTVAYQNGGLHTKEVSLRGMPDGIYFYRMSTPNFSGIKKLVKH